MHTWFQVSTDTNNEFAYVKLRFLHPATEYSSPHWIWGTRCVAVCVAFYNLTYLTFFLSFGRPCFKTTILKKYIQYQNTHRFDFCQQLKTTNKNLLHQSSFFNINHICICLLFSFLKHSFQPM